jgi:hypothetical protein
MIEVYRDREAESDEVADLLNLARQRLSTLKREVEDEAVQQKIVVAKQLERAGAMIGDDPQRAAAICRGVVTLYDGKYWATELVERAETMLESIPAQSTGAAR